MAKGVSSAVGSAKKGGKYFGICLLISTLALIAASVFQLMSMKTLFVAPF